MTVKQFMLKKYPTNEWMDCPVPKHHWGVIQEYAEAYHKHRTEHLHGIKGMFCTCGTKSNELDVNGRCETCGKKLDVFFKL